MDSSVALVIPGVFRRIHKSDHDGVVALCWKCRDQRFLTHNWRKVSCQHCLLKKKRRLLTKDNIFT